MTPLVVVGAIALGLLLGAAYFAGLWWTVARTDRWRRPGRALAISFVLRAAVLLAGLYLLARAGIGPLALGLLGLLLARVALSLVLLSTRRGPAPTDAAAAAPAAGRNATDAQRAHGATRPPDASHGGAP